MKKNCVICGIEIAYHHSRKYCKCCKVEVHRQQSLNFSRSNREYYNQKCREYHKNNPELSNERYRKRYKESPGSIKEANRKWRENNKEKVREIFVLMRRFGKSGKSIDSTCAKITALEQAFKRGILTPEVIEHINKGETHYAYAKRD